MNLKREIWKAACVWHLSWKAKFKSWSLLIWPEITIHVRVEHFTIGNLTLEICNSDFEIQNEKFGRLHACDNKVEMQNLKFNDT